MGCVVVLTALALVAGCLTTWRVARRHRFGWGRTVETGPSVGEGAYRSAPVRIERPRDAPAVCMLASVTAFTGGALITFMFAPGGLLLLLFTIGHVPESSESYQSSWWFGLGMVGLFVAVIRGFFVGPRLMRAVRVLATRRTDSAGSVACVARQSLFHHALVVPVLGSLWLGWENDRLFVAACALACAFGFAQAGLLLGARATLARLDREDAATSELA